jgi:hypothetical protein
LQKGPVSSPVISELGFLNANQENYAESFGSNSDDENKSDYNSDSNYEE